MVAMKILLICFQMVHLGLYACPLTVHKTVRGFGPDCKYRCNCRNNEQCDSNTGKCPKGCLPGWMGPACQYRNIAASAVNTSLHPQETDATLSSRKSVDLDETTCSKTGPGQGRRWLRISLDKQFYVVGFAIKLSNNQKRLLQTYSVEIGNSTDNWTLCFKDVEMSYNDTPIEVVCSEPLVGEHVRLSLSEYDNADLNICELEIFGGRLVSFNRNTQIDSTLYYANSHRYSSYGVDGKVGEVGIKEDTSTNRTCTGTNDTRTCHWWNVDLSTSFNIQGVSYFGRMDSKNTDQYRGFSIKYQRDNGFVEIFRDNSTSDINYTAYKPMSTNFTWPLNSHLVQVERNASILILCEVEVFADCPYGWCGWECNKTCMCSSQTTGMHKIFGTCPHGCAGRWTGVGRMCNTECNESHWGTDCTKKCGNCEDSCDVLTGVCPTLCKTGWMPPDCTQACAKGMYGDNCSLSCGFCRNNASCEHVDGNCSNGCDAGYTGPLCKTSCAKGMYGDNCSLTCGFCRNNASCEHVDGNCSNGCDTGYTGPMCKTTEETLADITRDSASGTIGLIVAASVAVAVVVVVIIILRRRLLRCMSRCSAKEKSLFLTGNSHDENDGTSMPQENRQGEFECYYNVNAADTSNSKIIEVSDLRTECRKAKRNLSDEFERIPSGFLKDASEALKTEYLPKNRYREICPYNENRVHLPETDGVPASTYINASYITGYRRPKRYIAAQGAVKTTVDDIWRMIWSEKIAVIVMLTDCVEAGKQKCVQYWPDEGCGIYGDIKIQLVSAESYTNFKIRTFKIGKENSKTKRTVVQFHFTAWPDKDVPDTALSIVQFWRKVREYVPADKNTTESPWLVHCSAGVGRTGTFIAMDYLYDQGQEEGKVDFKACVSSLRNERIKMVQTKEQYYLLHEIVAEILDPIGTACSSEEYLRIYPTLVSDTAAKKQKLYQEYKNICKASEEVVETLEEEDGIYSNSLVTRQRDADKPENIPKSRDPNICPEDKDRPYLPLHISGRGDFINAVYISTYRYKDRMILIQFPLKNTVVDFLAMLWELNVTEVVLLENPPPEEGKYWPQQGRLLKAGPITVKIEQEESLETYVLKTLRLTMDGKKEHKDVRQYHFQQWQQGTDIPYNAVSILQLISGLEKNRSSCKSAPLVIQCLDGAKRSGLFCVIYSVLESVKLDRQVAVANTLRLARVRRIQIISGFDQYKFCHEVINEYLQRFDVYANVT